MNERMNLNMEELEMVNGGTDQETFDMAILLTEKGYGDFYVTSPYGGWSLNVGEMHNFFESKGYKFTMRAGKVNHNIWHKNHLPFDYEYMMGMIENQKL